MIETHTFLLSWLPHEKSVNSLAVYTLRADKVDEIDNTLAVSLIPANIYIIRNSFIIQPIRVSRSPQMSSLSCRVVVCDLMAIM